MAGLKDCLREVLWKILRQFVRIAEDRPDYGDSPAVPRKRPSVHWRLHRCDVHGWMQAYVVVIPHPFAAVTGDDGSFRIEGVPPGRYKVRAWHEGMGQLDKDVVVQSGSEATVNFDVGK